MSEHFVCLFVCFRATQYACALAKYLLRNEAKRKELVKKLQFLESNMSSGRKRKNEHFLLHKTQNNHIQNKTFQFFLSSYQYAFQLYQYLLDTSTIYESLLFMPVAFLIYLIIFLYSSISYQLVTILIFLQSSMHYK